MNPFNSFMGQILLYCFGLGFLSLSFRGDNSSCSLDWPLYKAIGLILGKKTVLWNNQSKTHLQRVGIGRAWHQVGLWSVEMLALMPSRQDAPRSTDITVYVWPRYKNFFAPLSYTNTHGKKNMSSESQEEPLSFTRPCISRCQQSTSCKVTYREEDKIGPGSPRASSIASPASRDWQHRNIYSSSSTAGLSQLVYPDACIFFLSGWIPRDHQGPDAHSTGNQMHTCEISEPSKELCTPDCPLSSQPFRPCRELGGQGTPQPSSPVLGHHTKSS